MSRDLLLMALSLFTWGVGEGMFIYFQTLYLQHWGADPLQIGGILGAMGVAMAVAQAPAGYLGDRIGARPVMWASWILGCASAVLMALAQSLPVFIAALLLYGLTSFVVAPMNSYITAVRGQWTVERALTVVSAMFHLGAVAGPTLGGWIGQQYGLPVVYRIASGIFVLSTLIVLLVRKAPDAAPIETLQAHMPPVWRNSRFLGLLAMIFFTMFALYLAQPLTPNYLQTIHGLSLQAIGQLGSVNSLGNALLMLALGHLSAPIGFLLGQVLVGLFALLMWQGQSFPLFALGYFFLGGYRLCRSMALAYARTLVHARDTGLAFGLVETGNAFAAIAAPLAAGWLYVQQPYRVYLAALIGIGIMLMANTLFLPRGKPSTQEDPTPPTEIAAAG